MSKYATKEELIPIAKKYCENKGYEFLFVSDDATSFGYDIDGTGRFVHKYFDELAEELGAKLI